MIKTWNVTAIVTLYILERVNLIFHFVYYFFPCSLQVN